MTTDKNLLFITSKILDTEVALFHCLTNSILRVPNTVIRTLKADAEGNIWFFIARPQQLISQFEQEFPVSLKYFKKGKTYTMQVDGTARMLTNVDEIKEDIRLSHDELQNAMCTQLLIKVKIHKAEFCDLGEPKLTFLQRMKAIVYNMLDWAQPAARQYTFSNGGPINYGF